MKELNFLIHKIKRNMHSNCVFLLDQIPNIAYLHQILYKPNIKKELLVQGIVHKDYYRFTPNHDQHHDPPHKYKCLITQADNN